MADEDIVDALLDNPANKRAIVDIAYKFGRGLQASARTALGVNTEAAVQEGIAHVVALGVAAATFSLPEKPEQMPLQEWLERHTLLECGVAVPSIRH